MCTLTEGERLAAAAASLIGTPFCLHGRDPASGLDCVGLVHASLAAIGHQGQSPEGYALRTIDPQRWFACAHDYGLVKAHGSIRAGDVILTSPGPGQSHLAIAESEISAIHAHAGLRRVVRQTLSVMPAKLMRWRIPG